MMIRLPGGISLQKPNSETGISSHSLPFKAYDSQGHGHSLTITYTKRQRLTNGITRLLLMEVLRIYPTIQYNF